MTQKMVILGAGESGLGAAKLGVKLGFEVFLSDAGNLTEQAKSLLNDMAVPYEEDGHTESKIFGADLIVKSPGIPDTVDLIVRLKEADIPVISEIELAFRYKEPNAKVIAITGTNGKTTTTLLIHHLLKTAGFNVALGGNIGISFAKLVAEGDFDYYVIEVSSFQLDGLEQFRPDVAILLNITPDHLDRYNEDFQLYVSSKFRITENLTSDECFIYCADCEPVTEELTKRKIEACLFAISASNKMSSSAYLDEGHLIFNYKFKNQGQHHKIPLTEISLIGKHNMINAMAAVLAVLSMDESISDILKGLKTFRNAPHRLELVAELNGVKFINDSKATNVDAVYYALEGIDQPIIWVAGGVDKGNDYTVLKALVKAKVKLLLCLGKDNEALIQSFGSDVDIYETQEVDELVAMAIQKSKAGDVVLLSPACASFDLFKNYEDRGDQFKKAIRNKMSTLKVQA
jgi:UDP-N-acetylmuramoylalanine--D-glutamate ligase